MQDVYAETMSAINFNNGMVRMLLVDQDPAVLSEKGLLPSDRKPVMKQQIIMPLPGFLYMLTVIASLMEDPKMQGIIAKYGELGLIPTAPGNGSRAATIEDETAAA